GNALPPADDLAVTRVTAPVHAPPPPAPARSGKRRPARTRRRPLLYVLLALAAAGAAPAMGVLFKWRADHHRGAGGGVAGTTVQLQAVGNTYSNPDHPDTHVDTAPSATDGSTATYWYTQTYGDQTFGGLLTGLGLVLDAGSPVELTQVTVTTPTPGFTAE